MLRLMPSLSNRPVYVIFLPNYVADIEKKTTYFLSPLRIKGVQFRCKESSGPQFAKSLASNDNLTVHYYIRPDSIETRRPLSTKKVR